MISFVLEFNLFLKDLYRRFHLWFSLVNVQSGVFLKF